MDAIALKQGTLAQLPASVSVMGRRRSITPSFQYGLCDSVTHASWHSLPCSSVPRNCRMRWGRK